MRGPGASHFTLKRRSLCPFTCVPSPRMKRPPESSARSHAVIAVTMGLRGNATAMEVPSLMRFVWVAARARGRKGSWPVSAVQKQSKPASSAAFAAAGTEASEPGRCPVSSMMGTGVLEALDRWNGNVAGSAPSIGRAAGPRKRGTYRPGIPCAFRRPAPAQRRIAPIETSERIPPVRTLHGSKRSDTRCSPAGTCTAWKR